MHAMRSAFHYRLPRFEPINYDIQKATDNKAVKKNKKIKNEFHIFELYHKLLPSQNGAKPINLVLI